jgi:hypothetical protein
MYFIRLLVRQSGKLLHVVPRLHFVDSPEWFGVASDELFQVGFYFFCQNYDSIVARVVPKTCI